MSMSHVGFRHRHAKLIATETSADIGSAHHALELLSDQTKGSVARVVTLVVVDPLEVVKVDHHQRQLSVVSLSERHLALHDPLELPAVGQPSQVVGASFARELPGPVERDRHLVGDGGHEEQVGGADDALGLGGGGHHADDSAFHPQLGAQSVPLTTQTTVHMRLRPADGRDRGLHIRPGLPRELLDVLRIQADDMDELEGGTLTGPQSPGGHAQRRQGLDQGDLGRLGDVQRSAHRGHDRGQPVQLALPGAMFGVEMLEIAADHAARESVDHAFEPAVREREDLVSPHGAFDRLGDELDSRAPIYGQHVEQGFQGDALGGFQLAVVARALLVVRPR